MAITNMKPSKKLTVGAQYICFNTMDANNDWTSTFESDVYKLPTITSIEVSDETDSYETYASGAIYDADTIVQKKTIKETNIAFDDMLLSKMRGEVVDDDGVILEGGLGVRPFFAYGYVTVKKDGTKSMVWYPKCKLSESTDSTETSEGTNKDQTDDITITAYGFNDNQDKAVRVLTSELTNITELKFFAAPVLTVEAAKALDTASNG